MKTTNIINSKLTTIDLATLDHVNGGGGYEKVEILGKAVEGAVGGWLATPGDWKRRVWGAAAGAWIGGSGEFDREAAAHAAAKAERNRLKGQ